MSVRPELLRGVLAVALTVVALGAGLLLAGPNAWKMLPQPNTRRELLPYEDACRSLFEMFTDPDYLARLERDDGGDGLTREIREPSSDLLDLCIERLENNFKVRR